MFHKLPVVKIYKVVVTVVVFVVENDADDDDINDDDDNNNDKDDESFCLCTLTMIFSTRYMISINLWT